MQNSTLHVFEKVQISITELAYEQNCLEQRRKSQETSKETGIPVFVPVCKDDGSFVEVQCFYGTGYCWCVNQEGKPVPGTSIQYERPKCRTKVKRKRSRRGKKPRRNNSKKGSKNQKGGGKKGRKHACIQADRSEFNTQVVNLIITDYRTRHGRVPDGTMDHRREMIEWKFAQMDLDHNGKMISKDNELMNENLSKQFFCQLRLA